MCVVTAIDAARASRSRLTPRTVVAAGAALLIVALAAPAHAYTLKRTSTGRAAHWEQARVDVRLASDLGSSITDTQSRRAARRAAAAWCGLAGPDLVVVGGTWDEPWVPGQPGTHVTVQRPWPHAQGLLATTVTMYDDASGQLIDADILINPSARLTVIDGDEGDRRRWDLQTLLTHELGHVLGLGETERDPMATMWPTIRAGETGQRTLAQDDRDGIAAAYAASAASAGCSRASVASGPRAPLGLVLALLIGLAAWMTWRRRGVGPVPALAAFIVFLWIPSAASVPTSPSPASLDEARWAPFAGRTTLGTASVGRTRVGHDGVYRTRVSVRGHDFDVLGGCVDGVCQRFGEATLPREGEALLLAPATGAWAHVDEGHAFGGWLGEGSPLRLSADGI